LKIKFLALLTLFLVPLTAAAEEIRTVPSLDAYVGAEGCKVCHQDKYDGWKKTFHSTAVRDAKAEPSAILGDFSVEGLGFTREEVEFTIGAHWNQRYMKKIDSDFYILPKSWSISSRRWEPYNVWGWKKMPYSKFCIGCHVTRYDPKDGSFVEHKIGCESCHGPGKGHAETEGKGQIVNPSKLGSVEMEMICASCHVRGKDPSGEFQFPIGFIPGRNLADYYIPAKLEPGEPISDSLLRQFRQWWGNAGTEVAECEVCGLYGNDDSGKAKAKTKSQTEYCMGCHKFGEKFYEHTNHAKETKFDCLDCHKKVSVVTEDEGEDVHSISYFLVHKKTCYDKDYTKACVICHTTWSIDKAKEQLSSWKGREKVHD
jgi:hypothetical protein